MHAESPLDTRANGQTRFLGSVVSTITRGNSSNDRSTSAHSGRSFVTLSRDITGKSTSRSFAHIPRCHFFGSRQTATQWAQIVSRFRSNNAVRLALVFSNISFRRYWPSPGSPHREQVPEHGPGSGSGYSRMLALTGLPSTFLSSRLSSALVGTSYSPNRLSLTDDIAVGDNG